MKHVECKTQAELDAALAAGDYPILVGGGSFVVRGSSSVVAWGSSRVEAWGSSSVVARESSRVEAWESSSVVAWESSSVVAWGSSRVVARGSSSVVAWESSRVEATGSVMIRAMGRAVITASIAVVVLCHGCDVTVTGGIKIQAMEPTTAAEWCEHNGVTVVDGIATVYKGVHANYKSDHGYDYSPGLTPVADDWDGGTRECGGGLHFSPSPIQTLSFCENAKHFMTCQVALTDMRAPKPSDTYPYKIKAKGCCAPVQECDRDGKLIEPAAQPA